MFLCSTNVTGIRFKSLFLLFISVSNIPYGAHTHIKHYDDNHFSVIQDALAI